MDKPNNTIELLEQLKESDKTVKVSDVTEIVVATLYACEKKCEDTSKDGTLSVDDCARFILGALTTIAVSIATVDKPEQERLKFAIDIALGDRKELGAKAGGEA